MWCVKGLCSFGFGCPTYNWTEIKKVSLQSLHCQILTCFDMLFQGKVRHSKLRESQAQRVGCAQGEA